MQVRNVLTAMIDLLSGLERSLSLSSDVSVKLRGHVEQIESYMTQATQAAQRDQVFHSVLPLHTQSTASTSTVPLPVVTQAELQPANQEGNMFDDLLFEWPSNHQLQLQSDLTENWPFSIGGGLFDFTGLDNLDGNLHTS